MCSVSKNKNIFIIFLEEERQYKNATNLGIIAAIWWSYVKWIQQVVTQFIYSLTTE